MLTQIINGHILTPQGWMKDGSVLISDGKILEVTNSDLAVIGAKVVDADIKSFQAVGAKVRDQYTAKNPLIADFFKQAKDL